MSITVNNSVVNRLGTPSSITDIFSNRPTASAVATGTLFFSTDTSVIYQSNGTTWITYGGSGSTPTIQAVLTAGNTVTSIDMNNIDAYHRFYPAPYDVNNALYIGPEVLGSYGNNYCAIVFYQSSNNVIKTVLGNSSTFFSQGFRMNFDNNQYEFGDYFNNGNGTKIVIDDFANEITLQQDALYLNGAITSGTTGIISGQYLIVTINGTGYKITLNNL